MHVTQILNADSLFRTFQAKPKAFRQKLKRGFMHSLTAKGLCQKFGTNFSIFQIVGNKRSVLSIHAVFRFKSKQKNVWCTANMESKVSLFECRPFVQEKCAYAFHIGTTPLFLLFYTEYALRFFSFLSIYYLHSHVKTHSFFLPVDGLEHV